MLGFLARLVEGALDPLIDQVSAAGARLARKLALLAIAGVCLIVVLIALTIAFDLWIGTRFGAVVGALAVAGVYLLGAIAAGGFAIWGGSRPSAASAAPGARRGEAPARPSQNTKVDEFAEPLLAALAKLGLRREQLAVLAGSSLAKQLGPFQLVGLAVLAGFLIGRMWKSWRSLLSMDALAGVVASMSAIFGKSASPDAEADDDAIA